MQSDWQIYFTLGVVIAVCAFAAYCIIAGSPTHSAAENESRYSWWCAWCWALKIERRRYKHPHKPTLWADDDLRGFVLPAVMFALVITALVATATIVTSDVDRHANANMRRGELTRYVAEAGLAEAVHLWNIPCLAEGETFTSDWKYLFGDDSRYRYTFTRMDVDNGPVPPGKPVGRNCLLPDPVPGEPRHERLYVIEVEGRRGSSANQTIRQLRAFVRTDTTHTVFDVFKQEGVF